MKTFEELGVSPEILKAIKEMGYENPMPVQEEVIPYLLGNGNDVVALAQTGTGKTAAFGLPLIQKVDVKHRAPQALILCPTRELCLQIAGDLNDYSKYIDGLKILPVYGGSSIESQIRMLKTGVHIIVATPGRLIDLIERKVAKLETITDVVMDEADEMLNMGFTDSINAILEKVPEDRNTLMFSATMSPEISRIAKKYLHDAKEITIGTKNEGSKNVNHIAYLVHAKDKYAALKRIADYYPQIYGIIFCRTRKETQEIADKLQLLVKAKYNIFISGGTGSGKTTFLNALSNYIPKDERVITIEDSAELQIEGIDNLVSLETRNANASGAGQITIRDLIKSSLRMRPERIIVGECRGGEALDMLQAMNTGHDGSLSTGHANSTEDMLSRLETMVLQGAAGLPLEAIRQQIASAVDIIIHLSRLRDKSRKTMEITEVVGYENGKIILNPLYVFEEDEKSTLEKVSGKLKRTDNKMQNTFKLKLSGFKSEI